VGRSGQGRKGRDVKEGVRKGRLSPTVKKSIFGAGLVRERIESM